MRNWPTSILAETRYAARALRKSRGFAAVVLLTLALGIGGNSAMFAVGNAVIFRPLPFARADRLVAIQLFRRGERPRPNNVPYPVLHDLQAQLQGVESLAGYITAGTALSGRGDTTMVVSTAVTGSLFEILGVNPRLGRVIMPGDDSDAAARVVVISDRLWRNRLNGDPHVIGQSLSLDSTDYTIVGVMPGAFQFPAVDPPTDVWMPLSQFKSFEPLLTMRAAHLLNVIARLGDGDTVSHLQAETDTILARLAAQYPETDRQQVALIEDLKAAITGDARSAILLLMSAVGALLLIGCTNIAGLSLARARTRVREVAIRAALGASRGRLMRGLLLESLMLALGGGAVGLLVAEAALRIFQTMIASDVPQIRAVGLDLGVFTFAGVLSCTAGILCGIVPAWLLTAAGPQASLKTGGRGATQRREISRAQSVLGAVQVACTATLLIAAGLLVRSLVLMRDVWPGFNLSQVFAATVEFPVTSYKTPQEWRRVSLDVLRRLQGYPGVQTAACGVGIPFTGPSTNLPFSIEGDRAQTDRRTSTDIVVISADYFKAMQIAMLGGRAFTEEDDGGAPLVGIVNAAFRRAFFRGRDPVGANLLLGQPSKSIRIVGVAGDTKQSSLSEAAPPVLYLSFPQRPFWVTTFISRTSVDPDAMDHAIRSTVSAVAPGAPVLAATPMRSLVDDSFAAASHRTALLGLFGGLALLLAGIGIYGIFANRVAQRTQEIGVRIALGAKPDDLLWQVLGQAAGVAVVGAMGGLLLLIPIAPLIRTLLFHVGPLDPFTLLGCAALVVTVAVGGAYLPARRATRIDPLRALRCE